MTLPGSLRQALSHLPGDSGQKLSTLRFRGDVSDDTSHLLSGMFEFQLNLFNEHNNLFGWSIAHERLDNSLCMFEWPRFENNSVERQAYWV